MKETFTYSADRKLYEQAKRKAFNNKTTVSEVVRNFLKRYVRPKKKKAL